MKKISLSKFINIALYVGIFLMLAQRLPVFLDMYQQQGKDALPITVPTLEDGDIHLPREEKHLIVFWATWCGPCKLELSRINKMIKEGTLKREKVIAISSGEDISTVRASAKENDYQFLIGLDHTGSLANQYKVKGTPTLLLIDEAGKISWMTMGVSPSLEIRLKKFLK